MGLEPTTFGTGNRRAIHCATKPQLLKEKRPLRFEYSGNNNILAVANREGYLPKGRQGFFEFLVFELSVTVLVELLENLVERQETSLGSGLVADVVLQVEVDLSDADVGVDAEVSHLI